MGRSAALATPPPVGDRHDAGVEESDEGADVLGFPRLPEVPENVGLPTAMSSAASGGRTVEPVTEEDF